MLTPKELQDLLQVKDDEIILEGISSNNKLTQFYFANNQTCIKTQNSVESFDYFNTNLILSVDIKFFHKNTANVTFCKLLETFGTNLNFNRN